METVRKDKEKIKVLEERSKELNCLYEIEQMLNNPLLNLDEVFYSIIKIIPSGWQFSNKCMAQLVFDDEYYKLDNFQKTPWVQSTPITIQEQQFGAIEVYYTQEMPAADEGPFLEEERKLLDTIAGRIGLYILHQKFSDVFEEWRAKYENSTNIPKPEWKVILDHLKHTDQQLFSVISKKMMNHLFYKGIDESRELINKLGTADENNISSEVNRPSKKQLLENSFNLSNDTFRLAARYLEEDEIFRVIQKWINEEKSQFLVKSLSDPHTPLPEIADAIRRYLHINPVYDESFSPLSEGIRVSLIRRFFTDQLIFINIAKTYSFIKDFFEILDKMISPSKSHGKLGGKSAGLFLATKILEKTPEYSKKLAAIKTPKTWYITSDGVTDFIYFNYLEEVIEQKYKEIEEIRQEYPHIIQTFKNSHFSPALTNGLSRALDDFGDNPIIVRSSSLLEDRIGSSFAGKYKSLFLANQGSKQEKLDALLDAIAEVYASMFGPDPIGYRIERGLIDFDEEMGIMIQEVVGKKCGKYFFPAFAGVAFSNNEFRWSPRIKRDDGLIRLVPGLGTRAVDRIGDEYPILIAPGQPDLRVNLTFEDIITYAPKSMDVINLETNTFETIPIDTVYKEVGLQYPMLNEIFSILEENHLKEPVGIGIDPNRHKDIIATFERLISKTQLITQLREIIKILKDKMDSPVDVEFACDGKDLYLLQCRPQSSGSENVSAIIPKDVSKQKILFTANKYVSNGKVNDIIYIVYVDPENYANLKEFDELKAVGKVVGQLNKMLPKKNFILMGPGRWGSRDDIRLGVSVTYSDLNNTSVLIEIARKKGNYVPDLSFGTHFFQDLVEAGIRYLPLYPDEEDIIFNEKFFRNSENTLERFLPEYKFLKDVVKVINVPEATKGNICRVFLNADEEQAMALITAPSSKIVYKAASIKEATGIILDDPWEWRIRMCEKMASQLEAERFGVKGLYLFGTTFNKTAMHNSDIDILVHFEGSYNQRKLLDTWFEGWNLCLNEVNFIKTGYKMDSILDINFVTDLELNEQKYFADLMDPKTNSAKQLKLKGMD